MKRLLALVPRGSAVLAATTLLSYILGLVRDRSFAQIFGASRALDAYNAAFLLPDFLFNVLVASGIAAAVVPIYLDLQSKDEKKAEQYASTVLTVSSIVMGVVALVVFLFADWLSVSVAPGFSAAERASVAHIMRILAISPIFFAASNTFGSLLVARRKFLYYGLSPVMYNAGIIFGAYVLAPSLGVTGVALGTVGGAFLHMLLRYIDVRSLGVRLGYALAVRTADFKKTLRLMAPKMIGHPVELATFWAFTALASTQVEGSIATLNFARNFQSVPVSIIGIVLATTYFAHFSEKWIARSREGFVSVLYRALSVVGIASVVSAVIVVVFRVQIIDIFLGGRAFTPEAVVATAGLLGYFALSVPFEALSHILVRAWYATHNTTVPVLGSVVAFVVAAGGAWLLMPSWGVNALAVGFVAGSACKVCILAVGLPFRLRGM